MNKTLYIFLFLTAILVSSCVQPFDELEKSRKKGDYVLDLSFICTAPMSKARVDDKPGVDRYNENKIVDVDWFIFAPGETSDDEPQLCRHDRSDVNKNTDDVFKIEGPINMDQIVQEHGKSFYVYAIANLPASLQEEIDGKEDSDITLSYLQSLELTADFNKNPFAAQTSFVMQGDNELTFTDADSQKVEVTVKLKRVAAKVTIKMNVIPAFDQMKTLPTGEQKYQKTWYPNMKDIQVYLSFANKDIPLKGEPVEYSQEHFFTFYRSAFLKEYSYTGNTEGPSEIFPLDPAPEIGYNDPNWRWIVTGSPFYSYPMKWKSESPQAPFLKVILKWSSYEESLVDGKYTREKNTPAGEVDKEFYYKIPINPSTVSADGYYSLNPNEWYDFSFDVAILGSTAEELPVILSGRYYVVDWNDPGITGGGSLDQNSFLTLATKSEIFYMYGQDEIEIPVLSSHNLDNTKTVITGRRWNAKLTAAEKWESIDRGSVTVDGRSSFTFTNELHTTIDSDLDCYYMEFTVKVFNDAGLEKTVTIIQYPPIYLDSQKGGNAMVDGYYGNVGNHYRGTGGSRDYGNSGTSEDGTTNTPYGPITRYVNENSSSNNVTLTIVSISSLGDNTTYTVPRDASTSGSQPQTWNYIIADPREMGGFTRNDLTNYWTGTYNNGRAVEWNNSNAESIKVGSTTTPNFIAPKLLVASRWGRMGDWTNGHDYATDYEKAKKRCATYQEKGYPAGRWRLPTEAEVLFMVNMQKNGFIRELFTRGWSITASGSVIRVDTRDANRSVYYVSSVERLRNLGNVAGGTTHIPSCRCVYDLWYWGEDPVADVDGTYTIKVDY